MRWRWKETKISGNRGADLSRESGGFRLNLVLILGFLVLVGWGAAIFSQPYLRKARFEKEMEEVMRELSRSDQETMIQNLIKKAKELGLPPLTYQNFYFQGGVGKESLLQCRYTEVITLPGNYSIQIKMLAEKKIKIPYEVP